MNRLSVFLMILAAGCAASVRVSDSPEITAALAVEGAKAIVRARRETAPPQPVVPAGVCPRCMGKGYVGDTASIRIRCEDCKGTGKVCTSGTCGVRR